LVKTSQLSINNATGKLAEKKTTQWLVRKYGVNAVENQKYFRTPYGKRFIDNVVTNGRKQFGIEVKSGKATYSKLQQKKDHWIRKKYKINTYLWRR